jgi:threonine dehydratase
MSEITLRDVFLARKRIASLTRRTPLVKSEGLSRHSQDVHLKLETLQPTGSFKVRGAANKLLSLSPEERTRGVVAVSTGNHGRAVAYVARQLGMNATVCISARVPENKVIALRSAGVEVVIYGDSQDEAGLKAAELQAEWGLNMILPFDDPLIIAGQGTIGLELLTELPEVDTVLVPLSGGGLISGIALALKAASSKIRVVGVSMEHGAIMAESLAAGKPLELPEAPTLADSLQGGIGLNNRYTFNLVRECVDEVVRVSEEEIAAAMRFAFAEGLVLEGAGAVPVAALLAGKTLPGKNTALVCSGGNVDRKAFLELMGVPHDLSAPVKNESKQ